MGARQPRVDPAVHWRAARRARLLLVGLALLTVLVLAGGYVADAARVDGVRRSALTPVLIIVGVLGLAAGIMGLSVWAVRRRGISAVSPLWGVDRAARTRIVRALKYQQELTGHDRDLALAEAIRSRRLAPLAVPVLIVGAAFFATGVGLSLAGDLEPAQLGICVVELIVSCTLAAQQIAFYRRAGAYLDRFGAPPDNPTADLGRPL